MPDFDDILKMAQQAQEDIARAQGELDKIEVEGVAGGGLVKITATAKGRLIGISIDDSLIVPDEKALLEDLITAAFNDARQRVDQKAGEEMAKVQQNSGLPPGFDLSKLGL